MDSLVVHRTAVLIRGVFGATVTLGGRSLGVALKAEGAAHRMRWSSWRRGHVRGRFATRREAVSHLVALDARERVRDAGDALDILLTAQHLSGESILSMRAAGMVDALRTCALSEEDARRLLYKAARWAGLAPTFPARRCTGA